MVLMQLLFCLFVFWFVAFCIVLLLLLFFFCFLFFVLALILMMAALRLSIGSSAGRMPNLRSKCSGPNSTRGRNKTDKIVHTAAPA